MFMGVTAEGRQTAAQNTKILTMHTLIINVYVVIQINPQTE